MGWSSGLKMMQSTLQAKKVKQSLQAASPMGPPKSGSGPTFPSAINKHRTFSAPVLAPVIDLKSKKSAVVEEPLPTAGTKTQFSKPEGRGSSGKNASGQIGLQSFNEPNFVVTNEYDPRWPNDYHKVIAEMRKDTKKEDDNDVSDSKKRRYTEDGRAKARERYSREDSGGNGSMEDGPRSTDSPPAGFGRRPRDDYDDEDDEDSMDRRRKANASSRRSQGCKRLLPGVNRLTQRRSRL